jgi:hypothetical protein
LTAILWNDELDALLAGGGQAKSWPSIAEAVTLAAGELVTPEQARSRARRLAASATTAASRDATEANLDRVAERSVVRNLRADLSSYAKELVELRSLVDLYQRVSTEPIVVPDWRLPSARSGQNRGIVMASLADWHLDEVVNPDEILGLNAYNREIAMQRVRRWTEKVITLPRQYVNGLDIEGLIVCATGDLFTGEIHEELKETNEDKVLATLLFWMEPIIAMCELLGTEYPNVEIDCVPGNHTRMTEKYNHKNRVKESLEQFFWTIVKSRLIDRGKAQNVTINVSKSANMNVPVYGRNYLLDHGYEFKGGSGISGAFAPLSLGAHRKNLRQTIAGMPMQSMVIGHMHQIINIPGVIMGGTLKGYDEYAFDLNLRPDENGAGQSMWITAPERAQVLFMPVYVTDRKAEGW